METARVDLQRLQFLNDRIQQTIEALNQVRWSVHAMSHTADLHGVPGAIAPMAGYGQFPWEAYGVAGAIGAGARRPSVPVRALGLLALRVGLHAVRAGAHLIGS
jgi:hypothetical protein